MAPSLGTANVNSAGDMDRLPYCNLARGPSRANGTDQTATGRRASPLCAGYPGARTGRGASPVCANFLRRISAAINPLLIRSDNPEHLLPLEVDRWPIFPFRIPLLVRAGTRERKARTQSLAWKSRGRPG